MVVHQDVSPGGNIFFFHPRGCPGGALLDPQTLSVDRGFSPAPLCERGFLHPDALGQGPEDEGVFVPDQFGELLLGVAERFDREVGQTEDDRGPALWGRSRKSPTTMRSMSLSS